MVINKIITEKELNYIETLYLYCNLEDFATEINFPTLDIQIPIENIQSIIVYRKMLEYYYDTLLSSAEYIGESKGRSWYKTNNYRLGIMDWEIAKKANQFNIEIQYTQSHMFGLDENLKGLDLPFDGTLDQYHIKRVDVSQIVKTPYDYLTNHDFISPYRTKARFDKNDKTETVYLGNRKNGNVYRMYNKTIELQTNTKDHPINYKKIELFSQYFGNIEDLYTFELELHRRYLKPTFGIDTLSDLQKLYKAYKEIVGKIRIYKDTDENKQLIKNKNYDRMKELLYFVEYEAFERLPSKKYKPSEQYAIDKAIGTIETYERQMGNLTEAQKLNIIEVLSYRLLNKDIEIHIGTSEHEELYGHIEAKRVNQSNALEHEANIVFAPINSQNPIDLF